MAVVTTTSAVAGAVAANNSANQARSDRQKVEKCKLVIDGFDSDTANTQQMQQYAECVQVVYPETGIDTYTYVIAGVYTLCLLIIGTLLMAMLLDPKSR